MYTAELIIAQDVLDAITAQAKATPRAVDTFVKGSLIDTLERLFLPRLRKEAGSVKYPIQWTSAKQRKAFFASDGFGRGIPTKRTGAMVSAWVFSTDVESVVLQNPVAYTRFVVGDDQQAFHKNTGWYDAGDVVLDASAKAEDVLIEGWYSIASFEGNLT